MTHWSPLEAWRCQTVGYWDPRGLSLCCFCVRFRGVWKPWPYTCMHIYYYVCMYVCTCICHLHVLKLVASEGTVQLATTWDTGLQLFCENCRPYQCSVAHKHHRNLQIDNNNSQNWNNNYNRFIYVGDNNDCYTITQWSCNKLVSLSKWYVPLLLYNKVIQYTQPSVRVWELAAIL